MAVVKMQKLSICANKKHRKAILETLQSMGIMEVTESDLKDEGELERMDTLAARNKYEKRAASYDQALELLTKYSEGKGGGGLFADLDQIPRSAVNALAADRHKYNTEAADILKAEKRINECTGIIQKDENAKLALTPWLPLDIPLDSDGTKKMKTLIGTVPGAVTEADLYAMASKDMPEPAAVTCQVISAANDVSGVVVMCLDRDANQVENNLRSRGFSKPTLPALGIPREECENFDREIAEQKKEIEEQKLKINVYQGERENFRILGDYYRSRAEKYRLLGEIPQSRNVFFLEGWIPQAQADRVSSLLTETYGAYVEKEEKREDEDEPTLLHNNPFSRNVEGILASYDLPKPGRVDPTFIMSFFYVVFFGMMLSDAGYGVLMFIACSVILKKHPYMKEDLRRSIKLFFWCSISTTFWGLMYGGFFGDAIDVIATKYLGFTGSTPIFKPLWFAPLYEPMRLLVWCMLFGLIHMFIGLGIKGYEYLKDGDVVGFISDIIAWYLFLLGLIFMLLPSGLFASISGMTFTFPAWIHSLSRWTAIIGALIILVMSGRANRNWGLRIALGAYDLYNVTGWLSDTLSYSRLLALGLATGVIANVVNMMAKMAGGGPVGIVFFIVIFLIGHAMNMAINALGAYVHTNRLQYVEFFGKFYDAGGRAFKPFKTENKYIQIKEEK